MEFNNPEGVGFNKPEGVEFNKPEGVELSPSTGLSCCKFFFVSLRLFLVAFLSFEEISSFLGINPVFLMAVTFEVEKELALVAAIKAAGVNLPVEKYSNDIPEIQLTKALQEGNLFSGRFESAFKIAFAVFSEIVGQNSLGSGGASFICLIATPTEFPPSAIKGGRPVNIS